jgi:hypothetical protein
MGLLNGQHHTNIKNYYNNKLFTRPTFSQGGATSELEYDGSHAFSRNIPQGS